MRLSRPFLLLCTVVLTLFWELLVPKIAVAQTRKAKSTVKPVLSASTRVLVVKNALSPDSIAIADYYVRKRKVPAANVLTIFCPAKEECSRRDYNALILKPVKDFLASGKTTIDFILLTKGIPIRVQEEGYCVDSLLATLDWTLLTTRTDNPYFGKNTPFSHAKYHLYLVTRLDGYTRSDCFRLVDNALKAKPLPGPFLLDISPGRDNGGYKPTNDAMREAQKLLTAKNMEVQFDTAEAFVSSDKLLMGYLSWGSNDAKYNKQVYNSLRFAPGALAETAVSTSARTFENPQAPGQSLIADLIAQGVTGCKGYVSEPYVESIAIANILFDRYTAGYNLAESFYMASRFVFWKDIVIGDPLCAPYKK